MMEVKDIKGKRLGFIKDIDINFSDSRIVGFILSPYNIFKKDVKVLLEDVIIFNDVMIIKKISRNKTLEFSSIKGMDVIDKNNNILGMVEEMIFDGLDFKIQGLIISSGILKDYTLGKRVLLLKNLILGENNILCICDDKKIELFSRAHKIILEEERNEKMV